ncbi:MAG TPA: nucleotidyl transferase AbiEii/AbiGii toxin family protein [Anaerolineae bacterium]|nr:nucleotidyl transferase AbiEii/AbiGii toxin family protein [Anaerolineae bacterium]HQK12704.1 nucleotidyl transferase AbiEii/AbiGii toxin family protein [Anaerolineae bacterium]
MRYENGTAFRRALEDRLRRQAVASGTPLARLRKMVAFERFLARLVSAQPDAWVLKGGLALQFRLHERARATQDIDLLLRQPLPLGDVHRALVAAALLDLGDWFTFEVARAEREAAGRFAVQSLLDGRLFESFHVDVGIGDPLIEPADMLTAPSLLEFAGIHPVTIPAYPLSQQIAEKVHALTRQYASGESSRVRDWVDILLMAHWEGLQSEILRRALQATFAARGTHFLPPQMPSPPASWARPLRRLCEQTGLEYATLDEAVQAMRRFLDPVLSGEAAERWNPILWQWE